MGAWFDHALGEGADLLTDGANFVWELEVGGEEIGATLQCVASAAAWSARSDEAAQK
jgi:hypothetical protein